MDHPQQRRDKQEGELNRLGDASQHRGDNRRQQNRLGHHFFLRLRGVVERQRGAGQAEDGGHPLL